MTSKPYIALDAPWSRMLGQRATAATSTARISASTFARTAAQECS
eukprot:CAMPEP_0182549538 /NCGR_PEP_ID=MMETSP1323-20130603/40347_1 /TAXON_ID=236787 /ORGANISM="Florenciella parvula, Strain RCC1693" /LENGTH=44 /DNA_ID= /DNA_START= /DNA_END= /DNA_ORIENTATION=